MQISKLIKYKHPHIEKIVSHAKNHLSLTDAYNEFIMKLNLKHGSQIAALSKTVYT